MNRICKIKFCGVRRPKDIAYMNEFMPDYVGFVFAQSKRQVSPITAMNLGKALHPNIKRVGVFVNEPIKTLLQTAQYVSLNVVQLHGDEDSAYITTLKDSIIKTGIDCEIWKAIRVKNTNSISQALTTVADKLLLDSFTESAYGGSGKVADWQLIQKAKIEKPFFLAGGLSAQNITAGIEAVHPYGVDLSGGIETNGCKNREKIKEIIQIVRDTSYII